MAIVCPNCDTNTEIGKIIFGVGGFGVTCGRCKNSMIFYERVNKNENQSNKSQ